MGSRFTMIGLAVLVGVSCASPARPQEGQQQADAFRWRMAVNDGRASLFAADTDATDSTGSLEFFCVIKSGNITVESKLNGDGAKKFSKIIRDDLYPRSSSRASNRKIFNWPIN